MMITFDTLAVAEDLEAKGFPPEQAKAITRAVEAGRAIELSHLATKQDLAATRQELKDEIGVLRQEVARLDSKVEVKFRDVIIRFGWMLVVATGIVLTGIGTATSVIIRSLPHP